MKLKKHNYLISTAILILLLMLTSTEVNAIECKDFTFSHIGIENGLNNQRIYSICQTDDGAVWWTTKRGITRSNGSTIKNYDIPGKTKFSGLAGRTIRIGCSDQERGKVLVEALHIFDNNGIILKYNQALDRFDKAVSISELLNREIILNDIFVEDETIWLAMSDGIFKYKDNKITEVHKNVYANCFIKTPKALLCGTKQGIYNRKGIVLKDINVICGYYDYIYNKVWIGTSTEGVKVYTPEYKLIASEGVKQTNPVRTITAFDNKVMLFGVDGFGVFQANRDVSKQSSLNTEILFDANEGPNGTLHGDGIYDILVDSWGNINIGSYSGGVDIARPIGSTTAIFMHVKNNSESIVNDHVNCVMQTDDNTLVMGTDDGVSIFNNDMPYKNQWKHVGQGLVVLDLCKTPEGKLLVATYGKGVCEIDANGNAKELYSVKNGVLKDDNVYEFLYDRDGNLWMACLEGDLVVKTANGFKYYNLVCVNALAQLPDGQIAVGCTYGLYFVNPKTDKITEIKYKVDGVAGDDFNRYVLDLFVNDDNNLWIGTDGGGAYIYNLKTKKCKQISTDDGLPSNSVCSITRDYLDRLWLTTDNGIAFINHDNNEYEVVDVNYCYGLKREYTRGSVYNLTNRQILYGSVNGAVIINPEKIKEIDYKAKINNLRVSWDTDYGEDFLYKVHKMIEDGELDLSYDKRTFYLYFESVNMRNQFDIIYRYKIDEENWVQLTNMNNIRFKNTEPGSHELQIQCISKTSGVVLDEKVLTINISQIWWKSWWMQIIYLLLFIWALKYSYDYNSKRR